tara:strand:+ start:1156 stop:1341 length:186 start_codon:yes stop_codon:yes gene_type:complete
MYLRGGDQDTVSLLPHKVLLRQLASVPGFVVLDNIERLENDRKVRPRISPTDSVHHRLGSG